MSDLSSKTISIFRGINICLERLKNTANKNDPSLMIVFLIMDMLFLYSNTIYRSLGRLNHRELTQKVSGAVNAYCVFFDTGFNPTKIDNLFSLIDDAIELIKSLSRHEK